MLRSNNAPKLLSLIANLTGLAATFYIVLCSFLLYVSIPAKQSIKPENTKKYKQSIFHNQAFYYSKDSLLEDTQFRRGQLFTDPNSRLKIALNHTSLSWGNRTFTPSFLLYTSGILTSIILLLGALGLHWQKWWGWFLCAFGSLIFFIGFLISFCGVSTDTPNLSKIWGIFALLALGSIFIAIVAARELKKID